MKSSNIRFSLDIQSTQSQVFIPVSLNDTARVFHISLTDGSAPYTILDGCLAMVSIKRPSGTYIETFCLIEDNTSVIYDFRDNPDTAILEGIHDCQVTLFDADGNQVASAKFTMVVHDRVVNSSDIKIPDGDRTAVDAMIAREASRQAAEEARVNAELKRVDAENSRNAAEEERQAYYEEFMSRVDSGEFGGGTSGGSTGGGTSGGSTGGGTSGGDLTGLIQGIQTLQQNVEDLSADVKDITDRVSDLESGSGTDGGGTGGSGTEGGASGSGCNCPAIYTANSVEELPDPATVPENSLGFVPSTDESGSGNGGSESTGVGFSLPVVELTTDIDIATTDNPSTETTLTDAEGEALYAAGLSELPIIIKWYSGIFPFFSFASHCGATQFELGNVLTGPDGSSFKATTAMIYKISGAWKFLTWKKSF